MKKEPQEKDEKSIEQNKKEKGIEREENSRQKICFIPSNSRIE